MKKFFSLFAAVLFAGSMMAATAMTCAEAATAAKNGSTEEATITGYVTKIQEAWSSHKNISFWMADTKDGGEVFEAFRVVCETAAEAPAVGDKVQVTGTLTLYKTTPETAAGGSFVILEKAEEGGGEGGGSSLTDPTNCAEAAEAALSVSKNNDLYNGGKSYTIEGYVTSIATAYNDTHHNISFWMADTKTGGNVLEAFRAACASADDAPNVGDKVKVTGTLTKYGATPEFSAGCTFVITEADVPAVNLGEKTIAEFLSLKNTKDTCILKGIVENIKMDKDDDTKYNAYGNFDLTDETGTVYVYGLLTPDGEAQKFIEMGIEAADTVIVKAVYFVYNDEPQAKNAILVEHIKPTAITPVYSYDDEPTEVASFDLTLDYMIGSGYDTENHIVTIMLGDNSEMDKAENFVVLDFILDGYDSESGLPDGVYGISFVGNDATCVASIGGTGTYDATSYFGTVPTGETDYIPYYLVDGTVTIDGNKITVDATSYNGSTIKLTYEEVVIPDPTTCAEAADAALSVSEDNEEYNGGKEYSITGYVTSVAISYSTKYKNMTFWIADAIDDGDVLEAFKCAIENEANVPNFGDKVTVTGVLTKYGDIPEFKAGCTCEILEAASAITLPDPTNCAEASEAIRKYLSKNEQIYNGGKNYTFTGYVTAIEETYNKSNLSFWIADAEEGGNVLLAFRCVPESEDKLPKVGDKVEVTGQLTRYDAKPEIAAGCSCVLLEESAEPINLGSKTIAQFLELKNIKDTCVLTGIVKNIVMDSADPTKPLKYGNFDLEDETGKVFIYGLLTADGQKQKFQEMDIEESDELTVKAIYHDNAGQPQAVNAIYVSHKKNTSTAIDNTDEAVKAIKTFENGQLVIIKNGVKYNATGAMIR